MTERWRDLGEEALRQAARGGASYADVRVAADRRQTLRTRNDRVESVLDDASTGIGVRARVGRGWGFASFAGHSAESARRAAERAVAAAEAAALVAPEDDAFAPTTAEQGEWTSERAIMPFDEALYERADAWLDLDARVRDDRRIARWSGTLCGLRREQRLLSSEGADQYTDHVVCGGGAVVTAVHGDELQRRSLPASFDGNFVTGGAEVLDALRFEGRIDGTVREAINLLNAAPCPVGRYDVILESSQLALQIHESVGHPLEGDRFFGWENDFAGGTHVPGDQFGSYRYGSDHVTLYADTTSEGGLGSIPWDDEGRRGGRWDLVRRGTLTGVLGARRLDGRLGLEQPGGCMRAAGWYRPALVRMPNVSLAPDAGSLEDLIARTERGVYMETNKSFSIDDRRMNFQFGCEVGWLIEDGERTQMLKDPNYSGTTPTFWRSCDAVCGQDEWKLWGFLICGKGRPGQAMMVGHGAAPARFSDVAVGGAYIE